MTTAMRQDPYLWVHLAGLAVVPLAIDLCLAGLATAAPALPVWAELGLVALVGTLPVLWMQWQRPFYIFSLGLVALNPDGLTEAQRQILSRFRSWAVRLATLGGAAIALLILWQLYRIAPAAAAPFAQINRLGGLAVAAIAFLGLNLFIQVPISVACVLLTPVKALEKATPPAVERIKADFLIPGLWVPRILPEIRVSPALSPAVNAAVEPPAEPAAEPAEFQSEPAEPTELQTPYEDPEDLWE
ncbi:MAG: low-complexity tail membrane protein [Leptolyngbya sp. SIO4C1]|nr:low-complexity tail membrane protein [Leptolyngbya sp. SIO4C1]